MKNFLLLVSMAAVVHGMAQTGKGSTLLGGSLSLQTTKANSQFSLNPNVGYFIFDNFAAGAGLNMSFSKVGDEKRNSFGLGPFARYYFGKTTTKPFVVTEFNYNFISTTLPNTPKTKVNGFSYLLGLGFAAFLNDLVAVEGIAGYNYSDYKNNSGASGFNLRLGFQIYFGKDTYKELKSNVTGQ